MTRPPLRLMGAVLFISAGVLGFEISLMRILMIASWHHFAAMVISGALLGFGASGTCLSVFREWILPRARASLWFLSLVTALSMPACTLLAQLIPVESRLLPAMLGRQILLWLLYWTVLSIPFFLGAGAIGLALTIARRQVACVYAVNLLGSALGSILVTILMYRVSPAWLPVVCGGIASVACWITPGRLATVRGLVTGSCVAGIGLLLAVAEPHIRMDPYKYGAYVRRLADQHQARQVAQRFSPRSLLEAYEGKAFHDLPFLTGAPAVPAITVVVADGHLIGSVLEVSNPQHAAAADERIPSFAYELAVKRPRVLQLGMRGTADIWLSIRRGARRTDVVQPDANLFKLLNELPRSGAKHFAVYGVEFIEATPRHFVNHTNQQYDLIQLVSAETSAAGSGGIGGLNQDYLLTVEGVTACLDRLGPSGLLTVTRGVQKPPRDNLKLLATFVEALRRRGVQRPEDHVVIVRDFLAVCTVVKSSPLTADQAEQIRAVCADRALTPVWFSGIQSSELNRPDEFEPAPNSQGDWYHYAATALFSPRAAQFLDAWPFNINPATDDRPFFSDFCKFSALPDLMQAYGDLWPTRVEMAFLFIATTIIAVGVGGTVLIVLPLAITRRRRREPGKLATVCYFASIGVGYLVLEITVLSKMIGWVGDPVTAAAVTISGFLLFSGIGSLFADRYCVDTSKRIAVLSGAVLVTGIIQLWFFDEAASLCAGASTMVRCTCAIGYIAPIATLMGMFMPSGLARLHRGAPAQVPWAWGINGVASVLAAPLGSAIGMSFGYSYAAGAALAMYLIPAMVMFKMPAPDVCLQGQSVENR